MADNSLNQPVIVRAVSLSAASIPAGYSPAYTQYILSQSLDLTNVAGKANEAGQGAYDAQVRNEEQDVILDDHESRIQQLQIEVDDHEVRITANTSAISALEIRVTSTEGAITTIQTDLANLTSRVSTAEADIDSLQADYVSKSITASQSLASPLNVATSYSVGGVKVVGARVMGWSAATGTPQLGAFNADQSFIVGTTYSQSEVTTIANSLRQARQRILSLENSLRAHGLIN